MEPEDILAGRPEPVETVERCVNCRFCVPGDDRSAGECHADPPTMTDRSSRARWPVVEFHYWCGRYEREGRTTGERA